LVERIDKLLFCDQKAYEEWLSENGKNVEKIQEGEFLEFFRLIPTYTDRRSFYLTVLDLDMKFKNESLMSKAREFFVDTFSKMDKDTGLEHFTNIALSNLMYLSFEVFNDSSGPTDAALYEGLDTRNRCIMMLC